MKNEERIKLLDSMIAWLEEQSKLYIPMRGLCRAYMQCLKPHEEFYNPDNPRMLETFPALKVISTMMCGRRSQPFWWNPDNFKVRIRTLRLLRMWYRVKCYVFMIN